MVALLFVLFSLPSAAQAAPAWKEGVAEIEQIRDQALLDLYDSGAEFTAFLERGPSADDAVDEYAELMTDLHGTGGEAIEDISAVMDEFPGSPVVQDTGALAIVLINASQEVAESYATFQFETYMDQLDKAAPPPTTTTTTVLPATTTTTTATRETTTTTAPPATTSTTLVRDTSTTTAPADVTTTTVSPVRPSTTTTTSPSVPVDGDSGAPPDGEDQTAIPGSIRNDGGTLSLGSGDDEFPAATRESGSASSRSSEAGLTASLTRVLEPILPAQVTEVVLSPLFMLELLWRAITSSGQGLVAPISLLLFSVISLMWDRRRKKELPQLAT
jgi:hypothetical protein